MAKLWTKNFILLVIVAAFSRCSFDILLPTLPVFLTHHGNSGGQIGVIMGIFTFSAVIIRFFAAAGTQRFGIKRLLYAGLIVCSLVSAAYSLGTTVWSAASLRIIHGFGFGISTTLTATVAAGIIPSSRRGEGFGYLGFGALISAAVAPFLGLWLLERFGSADLFLVTALTQCAALICMMFVSVQASSSDRPATASHRSSGLSGLIETAALFPALLALLLGICVGSVMCFIALFGQTLGIANIGWFFLASTIGSFVSRLFAGRIYDHHGRSWVMIPGILITLFGLLLIAHSTSVNQLVFAALLYGIGNGAVFPALQAWITSRSVPERYNQANAMFYNAFDVGIGGGSILLGLIAATTDYVVMYQSAAFIMGILFMIYVLSQYFNRQKPAVPMKKTNF